LDVDAAKQAAKSEAAISYELYRTCVNAIQADDLKGHLFAEFLGSAAGSGIRRHVGFGQPSSDGKSVLDTGDFRLTHVIPEFKISDEDRVDLLITAEQYQTTRAFMLFECKRRPFQKPGPSYAHALHRQAMRYASKLDLQHVAVYDGWVIILAKRQYPFLLGILDAAIGDTLTPQLVRELLTSIRELENSKMDRLKQLQQSSRPKDPEFISRQVLPFIGKELTRGEKPGPPSDEEKGKADYLVKQWRKEILLL
jgi:hypothetical protein